MVSDTNSTPEEVIKNLSEANQKLMDRQVKLVKMLKKSREQFAFYAESHKEKGIEDGAKKAETNFGYVNEIDDLLRQENLAV